ncbi:unnamed protein product, partial [Polarella glacialis]
YTLLVLSLLPHALVAGAPGFQGSTWNCGNSSSTAGAFECHAPAPAHASEESILLQLRLADEKRPIRRRASRFCRDHFESGRVPHPRKPLPIMPIPSPRADVLPEFLAVGLPQTGLEAISTALLTLKYSEDQVQSLSDQIVALFDDFFSSGTPASATNAATGLWKIFLASPALKATGGLFHPVLWTGAADGALTEAAALAVKLTLAEPAGSTPYFSLEGNTLTGVLSSFLQFIPILPGQTAKEVFSIWPTNQKGGPVNPFIIITSFDEDGGCSSGNCFDFGNATNYPIVTDPTYFDTVSSLFSGRVVPQCKAHAVIAQVPFWFNFIMTDEMPVVSRKCKSFVLHDEIAADAGTTQSTQNFVNVFFGFVSPLPEEPIPKTQFMGQSVTVVGAITGSASPMFQCTYLPLAQKSIPSGLEMQNVRADRAVFLQRNLDYVDGQLASNLCAPNPRRSKVFCRRAFSKCMRIRRWRKHAICKRAMRRCCIRSN